MHRKCSSYLYDVGTTEKTSEGAASFQKEARRQETEGTSNEKSSF